MRSCTRTQPCPSGRELRNFAADPPTVSVLPMRPPGTTTRRHGPAASGQAARERQSARKSVRRRRPRRAPLPASRHARGRGARAGRSARSQERRQRAQDLALDLHARSPRSANADHRRVRVRKGHRSRAQGACGEGARPARPRSGASRSKGRVVGAIGPGLLVFAGVTDDDTAEDRDWLVRKIVQLRVFDDDAGVMNRSVHRYAAARSSRCRSSRCTRPRARVTGPRTRPPRGPRWREPAFAAFVAALAAALGKPVPTGVFGAHMAVRLVNDGPVTIWLDSRARRMSASQIYSSRLRSIHAFFSWTCMRCVSRSAVGSSLALSTAGKIDARRAHDRLVAFDQQPHHLFGLRLARRLLDRRELGVLGVGRPAPGSPASGCARR